MAVFVAIDQGTTSTKAFKSNADGVVTEVGRHSHRQIHPRPGWVEHNAAELVDAVRSLCADAGGAAGVGIANQGETVVPWDARSRRPLHNAIVWQDDRTRGAIEKLRAAGVEALTLERAGLPLDPYFSAAKLRWLLDHVEGARKLAAAGRLRLGTSDAFFLDNLTGVCATDVSTASRTSLINLRTLQWDMELCRAFGVPVECLPEIRPTVGDFGVIGATGAPVRASVVDQQAALFGHGCREPGDIKITFGTGAFALGLTGTEPLMGNNAGLLPTCAWRVEGSSAHYALDGGIFTAGSAIDWLKSVGLVDRLTDFDFSRGEPVALRGLMFVPAQAGLGCPYWDHTARALWIGMDLATGKADLCRAVYEGLALRAAQLVRAIRSVTGIRRISIDGGLSRSPYFTQLLADALAQTVFVAESPDLTSKGLLDLCHVAHDPRCAGHAPHPKGRPVNASSPLPEDIHARFSNAVERACNWAR